MRCCAGIGVTDFGPKVARQYPRTKRRASERETAYGAVRASTTPVKQSAMVAIVVIFIGLIYSRRALTKLGASLSRTVRGRAVSQPRFAKVNWDVGIVFA